MALLGGNAAWPLAAVFGALILCFTVYDATAEDDVAPTPEPPYGWAIFKAAFSHGDFPALKPDDYVSKSPQTAAAADCATSVKDPLGVDVQTTGTVVGDLKYNTGPRMTGGMAATNGGNTQLGPVHKSSGLFQNWAYKFEVNITFNGPLKNAFYGQMASKPMPVKDNGPTFNDDTPANDWPGKEWKLPAGKKKTDFPVVEVKDSTVHWIDAPGGPTVKDKKEYFMFYAGACGKVTHVQFMRVDFPDDKDPTAKLMTEAEFKKDAGGSFKFSQK
jgi:hypothetical protein